MGALFLPCGCSGFNVRRLSLSYFYIAHKLTTPSMSKNTPSPYVAARAEWNERYGSYIARAASWRRGFFFMLTLLSLSVAGNIIQGTQSKIHPVLIMVDQLGKPVNVVLANGQQTSKLDPKVLQATLAQWVTDVRSVIPSGEAMTSQLVRVKAMSTPGTWQTLLEHYQVGVQGARHDPLAIARTSSISVEVTSLLPLSDDTWQVEWRETRRNATTGAVEERSAWRGVVRFQMDPPNSFRLNDPNPLGFYVTNFQWERPFTDRNGS